MELTYGRGLKFLWSFGWRAWICSMPVLGMMVAGMFLIMPPASKGAPPAPPQYSPLIFLAMWFLTVGLSLAAYVFALRWTLKTRWSDFRMVLVPVNSDSNVSVESKKS